MKFTNHSELRKPSKFKSDLPSRTDQSYKKMCDINVIMNNYAKTGILPQQRQGQYIDVSNVPDLVTAFEVCNRASELFYTLPATVRKLMNDDPSQLANFVANSDNIEICEKFGLLKRRTQLSDDQTKAILPKTSEEKNEQTTGNSDTSN